MFPDPLFVIGLPVYPFGLIVALSLFAGYGVVSREMKRLEIPSGIVTDLAFAVMISAFLGARLFFVFEQWNEYTLSPLRALKFWEGGLILYGGLLGGLLGGILFCRRKGLSFAKLSDPVALGLCLGLALSRLGCLAAGCCFGKPTSLPWGITFEDAASLARPLHTPLHPTQLYSAFIGMLIFLFLFSRRLKKAFEGELLLIYFILESSSRIFLELFRGGRYPTGISTVLAVGFLTVSVAVYVRNTRKGATFMKRSLAKLAVLGLVFIVSAACGIIKTQQISRGHDISSAGVSRIQKGVTTEKDILHLFGPPTKSRETEAGKEFFYEYTKSGGPQWNLLISVGGGSLTKTLLVWFDKEGVVTDHVYKSS